MRYVYIQIRVEVRIGVGDAAFDWVMFLQCIFTLNTRCFPFTMFVRPLHREWLPSIFLGRLTQLTFSANTGDINKFGHSSSLFFSGKETQPTLRTRTTVLLLLEFTRSHTLHLTHTLKKKKSAQHIFLGHTVFEPCNTTLSSTERGVTDFKQDWIARELTPVKRWAWRQSFVLLWPES